MTNKVPNKVGLYLKKVDLNLDWLYGKGFISQPTRKSFFEELFGCHEKSYKNWYSQGIRKIYISFLDLVDEWRRNDKR